MCGEERQRSTCAWALAACLAAAEPLEGLLCSSSSLEDGLPCAVAAEDRIELFLAVWRWASHVSHHVTGQSCRNRWL